MKIPSKKEINDILEQGVQDGLYEKVGADKYRLTDKGKKHAEALLQVSSQSKLENFTFEEIAKISVAGKAKEYFNIGDTKTIELITGEIIELVIIDRDKDKRADNGKAAGITFTFKDLMDGEFEMNGENTNTGGWEKCKMRNVYMERILRLLPAELQSVIVPVIKETAGGEWKDKIIETTDKLFLFSEKEITGGATYSLDGEGAQYEFYKDENNRTKRRNNESQSWWLRSPSTTNATYFRNINSSGSVNGYNAGNAYGVCVGFCI